MSVFISTLYPCPRPRPNPNPYPCKHASSQEVLHALHFELERSSQLAEEPGNALSSAYEAVQAHLRLLAARDTIEVDARSSGACAIVALMCGRHLTVAGLGDCRAVLATVLCVDRAEEQRTTVAYTCVCSSHV